ncbi:MULTISPECIES: GNAT family N-acetyltransferase [Thermomonosporaceae]|uniref:GNAT family N-acetyltransferase n=1 Tax=Thermomonosporaceae TaxID=2012 RepID=UPI00255B32D3|nr:MULTISPECIES: GNAT family N-acetyltransferase [Thermomonosporaceae]MDL4776904.1 GNAT family N-acetyltransferase [Actinomadura xylanilytica]
MIAEDIAVRPATAQDLPAIADTLAEAFHDYAWMRWTVAAGDHTRRVRALQLYFTERIGLPHGRVWVAGGHGAVNAVSVWTTPATVVPAELFTAPELAELHGDRAAQAHAADQAVAPYRPVTPAWFLATIGVRRGHQGRGLGGAVLRPGLAEADREGRPVYLETASESNVRFYRRYGFEVTAETDVPDGGPHAWCMTRPARAPGPEGAGR